MSHRILVVDDEDTFRYFLKLNLEQQGYQVTDSADGQTALNLIKEQVFEVALIDLRLADLDGLEIVRQLRQTTPQTSVIILTGFATLDSAIEALRQGAYDYLTKPFETAELLARVADAIAMQPVQISKTLTPPESTLHVKDLVLNQASRQVTRQGKIIPLTQTEFDILATLMAHPNMALDSITLVKYARGYEATEAEARAITRVHVHRLRHKLEIDPANPQYISTIPGGRYLINLPEEL
ncbi:MAG: response regulator transcription factor [Anaerolineae bacterium]